MIGRLSHISDVTQRALAAERRLAEHMATTGVTLTTIRYYLLLCNNISNSQWRNICPLCKSSLKFIQK